MFVGVVSLRLRCAANALRSCFPCGREILSWGVLPAYMPSAVITSERSYPAMPLAGQPAH